MELIHGSSSASFFSGHDTDQLRPYILAGAGAITSRRRRLRVVIYARYSTEEQDASSIDDQIAYCKKCLGEIEITDAEFTILDDREMSGELRNRPGIDQIWEGISIPKWDLLVCEDAGRLFRNDSACIELIETAFDSGMRVICFNDDVDTDKEGWQDCLRDAAKHHAKANFYTRKRLQRKIEGLWKNGAAVTSVMPGYQRKATLSATDRDPEKGPYFDSPDSAWVPVVYEAYERVANEEPPWSVAIWLTERGLPKYGNSRLKEWSAKEVIALIRRKIYRGQEEFRKKIVKKKLRTGKKMMVWNESDVWTREMPHMRIVPDALWYRANQAIDARMDRKTYQRGKEHPLFGIPRDSRGPLSTIFVCGICGGKMYRDGRHEGGYRCCNARCNKCWNKATAVTEFAHARISRAIGDHLLSLSDLVDPLVEFIQQCYQNDDQRRQREAELQAEEKSLLRQQSRLLTLAASSDSPPTSLLDELKRLEVELAKSHAWLQELEMATQEQKPEVTQERILQILRITSERLLTMGREVGPILARLILEKIRAIPYMQFGTTNVVLRGEFELRLVDLLPYDLRQALVGAPIVNAAWAAPVRMTVDLFQPSVVAANALRAIQLYEEADCTLSELAGMLGMSLRNAHLAKDLGQAMREAGLTDPYIRLSEPPRNVAHWRIHPKFSCTYRFANPLSVLERSGWSGPRTFSRIFKARWYIGSASVYLPWLK